MICLDLSPKRCWKGYDKHHMFCCGNYWQFYSDPCLLYRVFTVCLCKSWRSQSSDRKEPGLAIHHFLFVPLHNSMSEIQKPILLERLKLMPNSYDFPLVSIDRRIPKNTQYSHVWLLQHRENLPKICNEGVFGSKLVISAVSHSHGMVSKWISRLSVAKLLWEMRQCSYWISCSKSNCLRSRIGRSQSDEEWTSGWTTQLWWR